MPKTLKPLKQSARLKCTDCRRVNAKWEWREYGDQEPCCQMCAMHRLETLIADRVSARVVTTMPERDVLGLIEVE